MTTTEALDAETEGEIEPQSYELRLYIAENTPKSLIAVANLRRICEKYIPGKYQIEVIDLVKYPQLARSDQILAIPTLVRKLPQPVRKIIGDLSSTERVLIGLDVIHHDNTDNK